MISVIYSFSFLVCSHFSGTGLQPITKQLSLVRHPQTAFRKRAHAIYSKNFGCKNENFNWKNSDYFLIFAQNIFGYTLEPPQRGGSNEF